MAMTLGAAARLAGVSKSTLTRAIKAGRMSAASRREDGSYEIDPAELCRAFPPRSAEEGGANGGATDHMTQYATADVTAATAVFEAQIAGLQEVSDLLRRQLDDVREDRDRWRTEADKWQAQAERLALAAPTPVYQEAEPEYQEPEKPMSWWKWLRSTG